MSDEMVPAHRRDYSEKYRMDDLRHEIEAFLKNPPSRLSPIASTALKYAVAALKADADSVVRSWELE